MNRKELVAAVAEASDLEQKTVDAVLRGLQSTLETCAAKGEKVSVPGFFALAVGKRAAREGRNPATGQTIQIISRSHVCHGSDAISSVDTIADASGSAGT